MNDQTNMLAMEEQRRRERTMKDLETKQQNTDRILKGEKQASEQQVKLEQQARERYQAQQKSVQQGLNPESARTSSLQASSVNQNDLQASKQIEPAKDATKQYAAVRNDQRERHEKVTRPPDVHDRGGLNEIQERWRRHEEAQGKRLEAMETASPAERAKLEREYVDANDRMLADSYKRQASWERNPEQKAAFERKAAEHTKAVEQRQQQDKQIGKNHALERVQGRNNDLRLQAGEKREPPQATQTRIARAEQQLECQKGIDRAKTREESQERQAMPRVEASERSNPALDRVQERNRLERTPDRKASSQAQARAERAEKQLEHQRDREQHREQVREQPKQQERTM